ncbi:hypothetical protein ACFQ51_50810 [Streptomyces kaempferi]
MLARLDHMEGEFQQVLADTGPYDELHDGLRSRSSGCSPSSTPPHPRRTRRPAPATRTRCRTTNCAGSWRPNSAVRDPRGRPSGRAAAPPHPAAWTPRRPPADQLLVTWMEL